MKIKKTWISFGMISVALGLGAMGWWTIRDSSSQVTPDNSSQNEQGADAVRKNEDGSRRLEIKFRVEKVGPGTPFVADPFAVQLSVLPDPKSPSQELVTDAKCVWKIESVQYRPDENALWRDVTPTSKSENAPVLLLNSFGDKTYTNTFIPRYTQPGQWKSVVRADVEISTAEAIWRGTVAHRAEDILMATDLEQRAAQRVAAQNQQKGRYRRAEKQQEKRAIAETKFTLVPGKRYISKIQWSEGSDVWRDVPAPNEGPVVVSQFSSLGLRAVKADPKLEWPHIPQFLPRWKYGNESYIGEQVFLSTQKLSSGTAVVSCGQQMAVEIRVLPPGGMVVYSSQDEVKLANARSKKSPVRVYARINLDHPTYKQSRKELIKRANLIRFSAFYADGKSADLINQPGVKDDIVSFDGFTASAVLRDSTREGPVTIVAELIDRSNDVVARSDVNATVKFTKISPR